MTGDTSANKLQKSVTNSLIPEKWLGKPYYSLDAYCKNTFRRKCYKIALNAHMTCPNRDGTLGTRGCIFCSKGGSGDFAIDTVGHGDIAAQLQAGFSLIADKLPASDAAFADRISSPPQTTLSGQMPSLPQTAMAHQTPSMPQTALSGQMSSPPQTALTHQTPSLPEPACIIAYFQAYTNTYAPLPYLKQIFSEALKVPFVLGISIATRPDCLPSEVLALLSSLKESYPDKFIWIELGLQTIHEKTAAYIRRGYSLPCFEQAVKDLHAIHIPVITHAILGLPGESPSQMLETINYLNSQELFGIKLQLLHVLEDTDLADTYRNGEFSILTEAGYLDILIACLEHLSPKIVIHRLTGDGPKKILLAPKWSGNKRRVLNTLHHLMYEKGTWQGRCFDKSC